ncbi:MAG: chorismate mutase, partial [Methanomassiliicoccaceae archaeon]|nr:chorismate mutase [Methanomassiliicoccaceae archaeon]
MDSLEQLRKRIEEIDEKIVELMIRRNDAARMIGELKNEHGMPVRNLSVESTVIERYRRLADGTS